MHKLTLVQKLSDKIRGICPDLMELSFGCEVEYQDLIQVDVDDFCDGIALVIGRSGSDIIMGYTANKTMYETEYRTFVFNRDEPHKIIGNTIQLEHVLRAVQKDMNRFDAEYWHYSREILLRYNLNLSFEFQSVETLQFLHDIICK